MNFKKLKIHKQNKIAVHSKRWNSSQYSREQHKLHSCTTQCMFVTEDSSYDWQDLQFTKPLRVISVMLKTILCPTYQNALSIFHHRLEINSEKYKDTKAELLRLEVEDPVPEENSLVSLHIAPWRYPTVLLKLDTRLKAKALVINSFRSATINFVW